MASKPEVPEHPTDNDLELRVEALKAKIKSWAEHHELWHDCGFKSWAEHYNDEPPENPCVLLLWFEGPLHGVLNGETDGNLLDEFVNLVGETDFQFDLENHVTASFWVGDDQTLQTAYQDYYEWR